MLFYLVYAAHSQLVDQPPSLIEPLPQEQASNPKTNPAALGALCSAKRPPADVLLRASLRRQAVDFCVENTAAGCSEFVNTVVLPQLVPLDSRSLALRMEAQVRRS